MSAVPKPSAASQPVAATQPEPALLDALEQGRLKREQLAEPHVAALRELKTAELRTRAVKLLER